MDDDPAVARMAAVIQAGLQDPMIRAEVAGHLADEHHRRQRRLAELDQFELRGARKGTEPADQPSSEALVPEASEPLDSWPLLVLDAGVLLARCRCCGWKSPHASTPDEAWAAFEAHACEERPA